MSIINNTLRHGNATSSEIVALTKKNKAGNDFGAPALTYIEEINMERRLVRSLTSESVAKPLVWGKFCEGLVFQLLGLAYKLCSSETILHPTIDYWSGTPDAEKDDTVCDIKCPFTLKSFCQLVQPLYDGLSGIEAMNRVRDTHKDGEKYYWQLVSNAILTGKKFAELIIYCPYPSELEVIKQMADGDPTAHFIQWASIDELPYINERGYYKNINVIRFEVPEQDIIYLTECVKKVKPLLYAAPSVIFAEHDTESNVTIVS